MTFQQELQKMKEISSELEEKYNTPFVGKYSDVLNFVRKIYKSDYEYFINNEARLKTSDDPINYLASVISIPISDSGTIMSAQIFLKPLYDEIIAIIPWMFETYDLLWNKNPQFEINNIWYKNTSWIISKKSEYVYQELINKNRLIDQMKNNIDQIIKKSDISSIMLLDCNISKGYDENNNINTIYTSSLRGCKVKLNKKEIYKG